MPDVDVYTEAVVISIRIKQSIDRKCLQRFRGNNKGERRYKILLCKVCFLARKDNVIVSLVLLAFFTDLNHPFSCPFIYFS